MSDLSLLMRTKVCYARESGHEPSAVVLTGGLILPVASPHMVHDNMAKTTREPPKTKAELREMLAEAVRNTQAENKRLQWDKRDRG